VEIILPQNTWITARFKAGSENPPVIRRVFDEVLSTPY